MAACTRRGRGCDWQTGITGEGKGRRGVEGTLVDKLASAIVEQANLLWNFGDDLEDMNSVLESISAALQDAERRSVKEKLVQLWLKQLKNTALDISDMIEDYQDTSDRLTAKVRIYISGSIYLHFYFLKPNTSYLCFHRWFVTTSWR